MTRKVSFILFLLLTALPGGFPLSVQAAAQPPQAAAQPRRRTARRSGLSRTGRR